MCVHAHAIRSSITQKSTSDLGRIHPWVCICRGLETAAVEEPLPRLPLPLRLRRGFPAEAAFEGDFQLIFRSSCCNFTMDLSYNVVASSELIFTSMSCRDSSLDLH